MFTGLSSATRASHQRAISSAWRLVSEAAKRQPTLPVQATRPARIELALVDSPRASMPLTASGTLSVGTLAMLDENAHDGVGQLGGVFGHHDHAGLAREVVVTGDAAEHQAKPDTGHDPEAVLHVDSLEPDVVGVFQHWDDAAAIEGDVELARKTVKRALIEDVEVPLARIGAGGGHGPAG